MWRKLLSLCLAAALPLSLGACQGGDWLDLQLFCDGYNDLAGKNAVSLTPESFQAARREDGGARYQAWMGETKLLVLDTLPNGRIHTISLTGLPDEGKTGEDFMSAARLVAASYTRSAPWLAVRRLHAVEAGTAELPGWRIAEEGGFRFSYSANQAGRYLRISQLRYLAEEEVPTLRANDAQPLG
ncbi:MAG: hypothetical protein FWH26_09750 [Oscillospiraceae bacterium]|nr:hypothetical protein [Oscillospiraceae bacterium]